MKIAAYIMFCEEDLAWLPGFLANAEMLGVDLGWHLDHCSPETKKLISEHPLTKVVVCEDNEAYLERFRARPFHALQRLGYDWLFHWDIDERWDPKAVEQMKLDAVEAGEVDVVRFPMFTAWETPEGMRLRVDTIFDNVIHPKGTQTNRMRMYNGKYEWAWLDNITVGPYKMNGNTPAEGYTDYDAKAPIIHLGYSTDALRQHHKVRWDANYTRAVGRQPYSLWNYITDPEVEVKLAKFEQYDLQPL